MRIRTFLKPLSFLPAILLMYMIFTFSAQEGDLSASVSYKASCVLVKTADRLFDMGLDDYQISYFATKINGVTRKVAHMTEYFLLAIAVSFPLYVYGLRGILLMILAGGFCIAFACGDEYHQSFVAGRSPSSKDVLIDSIGVFIGIIVVRIVGWTGRMTLFRPIKEPEPEMQQLSRKEQKRWKKQQKAIKKAGKSAVPYQNEPYQNGSYRNGPYQNGPYQNGPYQNGDYQNSPGYDSNYAGPQGGARTNPGNPGPDGSGQTKPYGFGQNGPYQNGPYRNGSYPNGSYQNGPYPNGPYQNEPYQNGPYPNGPYPNGSYNGYGPYPYEPQAPQYMGRQEDDHSSDELAEDMPLSHLLRPKK